MKSLLKNLHLLVSIIIVTSVSFIYGFHPQKILPLFFDFKVEVLELKNIFRSIMGLYLAFVIYWIVGVVKPKHWKNATKLNILFMGGLAFGRIISTLFDDITSIYLRGVSGIVFDDLGSFNLKKISYELNE